MATESIKRADFGPDFTWGVATSAFQIEGARQANGRGDSIWDVFLDQKLKDKRLARWLLRPDFFSACEHFHRMESDIDLIKALNVDAYRFSIAWPRLLPNGTGQANALGIDFYDRLIDGLLAKGITPWATMYHWDLPNALELGGGWTNRDSAAHFADYAELCAKAFGDRVKHWIVLNEALAFTYFGYCLGFHAPGKTGEQNFLPALHHSQLAQGRACRALRAHCKEAEIGTAICYAQPYPATANEVDRQAAMRTAALQKCYVDTLCGRGYATDVLPGLRKLERYIQAGDMADLQFPIDFLGINHYFPQRVKFLPMVPITQGFGIAPNGAKTDVTDNGWEIFPTALFDLLQDFASYVEIPKIYITENGMARHSDHEFKASDGGIHDAQRLRYYTAYLHEVLRAKRAGSKVCGYFSWSLLDNLEWADGYEHRFGLYYVDYETQERTLKDSGKWWREFLAGAA